MKRKHYIVIALAVIFNDFVGSLIFALGLLCMKIGTIASSIPNLF
jgi:hypothetical protein